MKQYETLRDIEDFWKTAMQLEDSCFRDMTLEEYPTILTEQHNRFGFGIPSVIDYMRTKFVLIRADDDTDTTGYLDYKNRKIAVRVNENGQFDYTNLAHEMIHYYEHALDRTNTALGTSPALRQFLAIQLYEKHKEHVPNIDRRITEHLEGEHIRSIEIEGGEHDVLFLLKSWDIDWLNDLPWGTVFGYGYKDTQA